MSLQKIWQNYSYCLLFMITMLICGFIFLNQLIETSGQDQELEQEQTNAVVYEYELNHYNNNEE